MRAEAAPVIEKLNLKSKELENSRLPIKLFTGVLGDKEIFLVTNGRDTRHGVDLMGSQPAVLATNFVGEHGAPDLMISAGTAGGLSARRAKIGDVYLSSGPVRFHDRRYPIPGFREYGVGNYPSLDASSLGFKLGRVSSGDSLYMSAEEAAQFAANECEVKDMEAAAVAWVASLYEIPFVAIKVITDLMDHPSQVEKQFVQNFEKAALQLSDAVLEFLHRV